MSAKSLLHASDAPLVEPEICKPGRQEVKLTFRKDGRLYHLVVRDKIVVEDPYLMLVKAIGFAVHQREPYMGQLVPRAVKDFLIKSNVVNR
jgi:hypothetical protein